MAKSRRFQVNPLIRSAARTWLRAGRFVADILMALQERFGRMSENRLLGIIQGEQDRIAAVDRITSADKRKRVDLARRLNCPPGTMRIRMRITVHWVDPESGVARVFGDTVETGARGRLADLLNQAIGKVLDSATGRGYLPPNITSARTSGRTFYRIEYAECV